MDDVEGDLAALALLDEPTRRRLYEWVTSQGRPVGREEAARATGTGRALAAFHLDKLARAGLLDASYQRLSGRLGPGAGRPAKVYTRGRREISVTLPDRRYARLAELFATALEGGDGAAVPEPLRSAARSHGEALAERTKAPAGVPRLLEALESGGYEPSIDATGSIRLGNCPFDALVGEHRPLVCGTNLALAEGIGHVVGPSGLRPVLDPQPGSCCVAFVPEGGGSGPTL